MAEPNLLEKILFGPYPRNWSELAHRLTKAKYYSLEPAEVVDVYKLEQRVARGAPINWLPMFADQTIGWNDKAYEGSFNGMPMQNGRPNAQQFITWGYGEFGKQEVATLPLPAAGRYFIEGHPFPTPTDDQHCVILDPNTGLVHELIQFKPQVPFVRHDGNPLKPIINQALGWGVWRNGALVGGRAVTAPGLSIHARLWTKMSKKRKHRLALVLSDYEGADGLLGPGEGPRAGSPLMLIPGSPSHMEMMKLGGECAAVADTAATFGMDIIDRNSYSDVKANERMTKRGTKPHAPKLHIQLDGDWKKTNLSKLKIRLGDLCQAVPV